MKAIESTTTHSAAIQRKSNATPFFQQEESREAFFGSKHQPALFFNPTPPPSNNPSSTTIQAKLTIGAPNDVYEQEADAMADKVVQRLAAGESKPSVQRKCAECAKEDQEKGIAPKLQKKSIFESNEEPPVGQVQRKCLACTTEAIQPKRIQREGEEEEPELQGKLLQMKRIQRTGEEEEEPGLQEKPIQMNQIQRMGNEEEEPALQAKGGVPGLQASADLESRLNTTKGSGSPLPHDTRSSMESSFGTDFSNVRVHTNNSAVQMNQELGAQAFTHGSDIYFNSGKYDTGSKEGQRLLAHELTHTVQQGGQAKNNIDGAISNKLDIQTYPETADYRIRGLYERSSRHPTLIFFDFDSDDISNSNEVTKIERLSTPLTRTLRLVGKASEEGNPTYNRNLARRRAQAVKTRLNAENHTGLKPITVAPESGQGAINYKFKRQVEIVPQGQLEQDPNCGTNPDPRVPCSNFPSYSDFATRLGRAEGRVDDGISALDEYSDPSTPQARRDAIGALLRRFFGSDTASDAGTLRGNLTALKSHLSTHVSSHHECHNLCDTSCASGSTAYNTSQGPSAKMVLCERYFQDSTDDQEETLVHESVHGMGPGRRPDRTYRWTRLFGTTSQALGIPTAQALNNPDHIVFFLREIRTSGSTDPNRIADDTFDSSMNTAQRREAFLALAHLEWWLVRGRQMISSFYNIAVQRARDGETTWSGSPGEWHVDILRGFNTHFGTVAYPRVPRLRDREVYAGISQRYMDMNLEVSRNRQTFSTTSSAAVTWDRGTHNIALPAGFFGRPVVDQIKALALALAMSEPTISNSMAVEYPDFIDKIRRTDNVGP